MKLLAKLWPFGLILAGAWLFHLYGGAIGREAVLRQQIKQDQHTITAYRNAVIAVGSRIPKVDAVRKRDAVAASDWAGRYQRLRDSLFANTESDIITPAIIIAADSAVASCTRALRSCEAAVAIRDTALAQRDTLEWAQDSLIAHLKQRKPFLVRLGKPLGGFAAGVITGLILNKK